MTHDLCPFRLSESVTRIAAAPAGGPHRRAVTQVDPPRRPGIGQSSGRLWGPRPRRGRPHRPARGTAAGCQVEPSVTVTDRVPSPSPPSQAVRLSGLPPVCRPGRRRYRQSRPVRCTRTRKRPARSAGAAARRSLARSLRTVGRSRRGTATVTGPALPGDPGDQP